MTTDFGRDPSGQALVASDEARRAATGNTDAVEDESAGPQDIAQNTSEAR